jgi:soluble lytic murein transglycosylase-like protein
MPSQQIDRSPRLRAETQGPHRPDALLRSRWVRAALAATVAVQVAVGVIDRPAHPAGSAFVADARASAPAAIQPATSADRPSKPVPSKAMSEARAENPDSAAARLAAEYRQKGFAVDDELAHTIVSAAASSGIGPDLAFGLVATESEFKRTARSPVGAIGLTQLMPATARLFKPGTTADDLKNPELNASIGFRFLGELIDHYRGDTATALTAYNRGPAIVDSILAIGGDPDNGYAGKVLGD